MKKTTLLLALLILPAATSVAQQAKGGQTMVEVQSPKKEEKKTPVIPPKPTGEILGKQVIYGGYLTDLKRAPAKRSFFSLRTPLDPEKDTENLWYYPGATQKVQGVVLFSIKF